MMKVRVPGVVLSCVPVLGGLLAVTSCGPRKPGGGKSPQGPAQIAWESLSCELGSSAPPVNLMLGSVKVAFLKQYTRFENLASGFRG